MSITFFVPGKPATAGSKKGFYNEERKRVFLVPDNEKQKPWMNTVAFFAQQQYRGPLLDCPLKLTIEYRLLRPQGHYGTGRNSGFVKPKYKGRFHAVKPDLGKLTRAIEDALTGIVWRDDSRVSIHATQKVYVDRDPGAMVQISEITECNEASLFDG